MNVLKKIIHPQVKDLQGKILDREAARGIVLDGENILLLYTKRYNDYSIPGGGLDPDENQHQGLVRELQEETGAQDIIVLDYCGLIEEYRPYYKSHFDIIHMLSHYFICQINQELGQTHMEDYEHKNGMEPLWVNIHEAIAHNEKVMRDKESTMGLSIERETFMLKKIASDYLKV